LLAARKYRLPRLTHLVNAPGLVKPAPSLPFTAFLPLQLPNLGSFILTWVRTSEIDPPQRKKRTRTTALSTYPLKFCAILAEKFSTYA
jgi:hypothetical protein